jgi:hypothetical protein
MIVPSQISAVVDLGRPERLAGADEAGRRVVALGASGSRQRRL